MPPAPQRLDDLAAAVLDGVAVDWDAAESSADPDERPFVAGLRLVASVAGIPRDAPPPVPARWGHLHLVELIGRGAFGEVFRAWDPRLDREVALKLLPAAPACGPDTETQVIREGRLLAKVRHPNVVTIYGAEQIGGRIGLWMELVRGRTLEDVLAGGTAFGTAEALDIGLEVCRAVAAVHAAGLLHRDIKAQNVLRADDGRVLLADFGTGREFEDTSASDLTGTPLYLAPEVLAGGPATVESDVYSLGVLLYHLLTGSYPVRGRTARDVRRAHEQQQRVAIRTVRPGVSPRVARIIERTCDPRPAHRYRAVDALARDLAACRRRPVLIRRWSGVAAVAAVLVAGLLSVQTPPPAPTDPAIVVLPFRNLGSQPGSDLLVDSVTAGLVAQLAIIDGLQVRSQTTSFMLKDRPRDLSDLGRRLGVNLAVEGTAQLTGNTLVVHAALVPVAGDDALWAGPVTRELRSESDVSAVVEDVTRTIVNRLRLQLGPTQRRYDNVDIATYETYLRARELRDKRGRSTHEAIPLFDAVLASDPSYAKALAALAATYGYLGLHYPDAEGIYMPPGEAAALAEPLALKALEIDPTLAEAHAALGFVHAFARRWTRAEASFRRAIELEPSLTTLYGDFVLSTLLPWGRVDEALQVMQDALDADPLSLDLRRILANVQIDVGLYDDAVANCDYILGEQPDFPFVALFRARALLLGGRRDEALDWFNEFAVGRPGVMGWIYAINGEREEAERVAALFDHLPQRQAEIFGLLGDGDRALEALARLARINPGRAGHELTRLERGPLRGDARAADFRRRLGFPPS